MKKQAPYLVGKFGRRIRALRLELGLSQEELAYKSGLDRSYISSLERGQRNIALRNIGKLADALGFPVRDLFPE